MTGKKGQKKPRRICRVKISTTLSEENYDFLVEYAEHRFRGKKALAIDEIIEYFKEHL